jgi:hypothetical protein
MKNGLNFGCCESKATSTGSGSEHASPTSRIFEVSSKIATRIRQSVRRTKARCSEPMSWAGERMLQHLECTHPSVSFKHPRLAVSKSSGASSLGTSSAWVLRSLSATKSGLLQTSLHCSASQMSTGEWL